MLEDRGRWLTITPPAPLFFVSVASKGLTPTVSLLFATLARRSISVAAKGLTGADCWRESNCVGSEDSEEVRRTTWRAAMICTARSFPTRLLRREGCADYSRHYSILVQ